MQKKSVWRFWNVRWEKSNDFTTEHTETTEVFKRFLRALSGL
jgi:hypothetical protein